MALDSAPPAGLGPIGVEGPAGLSFLN